MPVMYMVCMKNSEIILVLFIRIQRIHMFVCIKGIEFPMLTHERESQLKQICFQKLQIRTMLIFSKIKNHKEFVPQGTIDDQLH